MKSKTSQGKKLAFGFLSRVASKDKYAKKLDKLKQVVLQGNSDLNGPLQRGEPSLIAQPLSGDRSHHLYIMTCVCLQNKEHLCENAVTIRVWGLAHGKLKVCRNANKCSLPQGKVRRSSGGLTWHLGFCQNERKARSCPLGSIT